MAASASSGRWAEAAENPPSGRCHAPTDRGNSRSASGTVRRRRDPTTGPAAAQGRLRIRHTHTRAAGRPAFATRCAPFPGRARTDSPGPRWAKSGADPSGAGARRAPAFDVRRSSAKHEAKGDVSSLSRGIPVIPGESPAVAARAAIATTSTAAVTSRRPGPDLSVFSTDRGTMGGWPCPGGTRDPWVEPTVPSRSSSGSSSPIAGTNGCASTRP